MGLEPWLTLGGWIDTVSGVLFALLGVAVALVRPRRLLNAGFALFAIGFGVHFVCSNIRNVVPAVPLAVYDYGGDLGMALWAPGAVLVAERFPAPWRPLQASGRRLARGFTAVYLAAYIGIGWITAAFGHYDGTAGEPRWYDLGVAWPVQNAAWAALWMVLLALPLRFATPGPAARDRRAILLVAASLLAYNNLGDGMAAGVIFLHGSDGGLLAQGLADLVATLVVACLWAVAAARTTGADRRAAGWMAALGLACYAGGILFEQAVGSGEAANLGLLGLSRIAGVAVLAYAILRLQLFDIDVKVKWTLGRSTLVGIFVAVFFVVDQLIQVFAGRAFGPVAGKIEQAHVLRA